MKEYFLFEIPIYKCSKEKHLARFEKIKSQMYKQLESIGISSEQAPNAFNNVEIYNGYYPWDYNEVYGYIRFVILGNIITGQAWIAKNKFGKMKFWFDGFEPELLLDDEWDSATIFRELKLKIDSLENSFRYNGKVIDRRLLDSIGNHIDWKSLCNDIIRRNNIERME